MQTVQTPITPPAALSPSESAKINQRFQAVVDVLEGGVKDGVFPGAVLAVGLGDTLIFQRAAGRRYDADTVDGEKRFGAPAMRLDTVFDLGSLTNIVVTTTIIMKLLEERRIKLDDRVSRYIEGFGVLGKSAITVGQVLSHQSGLAPWVPFYEELLNEHAGARMGILTSRGARQYVYNSINRSSLKQEPGTKQVYSDVGFILLGHMIEELTGQSLEKAAQRYVFQPLGMRSSSFIDLSLLRRGGIQAVPEMIAPTEECPWRKTILCGEVHDDNAWAMGGVAGHAGVFSSSLDLSKFAREMILAAYGRSTFLRPETLQLFWGRVTAEGAAHHFDSGWRFGWDTPTKDNAMIDAELSDRAVGECSFPGCSLWLDPRGDTPQSGLSVVLLTNRVHPTRANKKIRAFRPQIHAAIVQALTR